MTMDDKGRDHPAPFFTEENKRLIYRAMEVGATNKDAAALVGCHVTCLYKWLERGKAAQALIDAGEECPESERPYAEFREEYYRHCSQRKVFHLQNIVNAAKSGQWQASAWYLERAFPQEYARTTRKPEDDSVTEQINAIRDLIAEVKKDADVRADD